MKEFSELSIEEKAKAYDEAIKRANELNYVSDKDSLQRHTVYHIFPELKESEDEKIKEAIIDIIESQKEQQCHIDSAIYNKMIAWLEKQGEQEFAEGTFVNVDDVREDFIQEVYRVLDADSTNDRANQIIDAFDNLPTVTIEKQGENHDDKYNITGIKSKHAEGKLGEMIKNLKSANEVESKFKSGDWIVRELDNSVHQVKNALESESNGKYAYDLTDGGYISTSHDSDYHLWTILDAKAGDVLATGQGNIFIFKSISDCVVCDYCGLYYGKFMDCSANVNSPKSAPIGFHPATKEQREQLEKAMSDAGYTFDFERKELKKIEDKIEIPYGSKDSELQEATYYIPKGFHAEIDVDKVVIKKGERPIDWSEEDENRFTNLISLVKCSKENNATKAGFIEFINKLKSLKDRVGCEANCTTTKEWSVEDMSKIQRICKYLDEAKKYYADITEVRECMDWLKSLKDRVQPQSKQEWSKEDDRMLNTIIADLIGLSHSNTSTLESHFNGCIDWIKSIKDRYI